MLFTWEAPDVFMVQSLVSNLILQILPIFFMDENIHSRGLVRMGESSARSEQVRLRTPRH